MACVDKTLQCSDCGTHFIFNVEEQEFFKSKGYIEEPKRCLPCRRARRVGRRDSAGRSSQPHLRMFPIICARRGKKTRVPFQPQEGRQVYCRECYISGVMRR